MPFLGFLITEYGRNFLGVVLLFLNMILWTCAILLLTFVIHLILSINHFSNLLNGYSPNLLAYTIIFIAFVLIMVHVFGAKICYNSGFYRTRTYVHTHLLGVAIFCLGISIVMIIINIWCKISFALIDGAIERGFSQAMSHYSSDPRVKRELDTAQSSWHCCGLKSYEDWLMVAWLPLSHLAPDTVEMSVELQKEIEEGLVISPISDPRFKGRGVPFSCCDVHALGPCTKHSVILPQPGRAKDKLTLYKQSCIRASRRAFQSLYFRMGVMCYLIMFLEWAEVVLIRYLQTSVENDLAVKQPFGLVSAAWIAERVPHSSLTFGRTQLSARLSRALDRDLVRQKEELLMGDEDEESSSTESE